MKHTEHAKIDLQHGRGEISPSLPLTDGTNETAVHTRKLHGAIFVLGMHRSGTSCLAGSLQQRGLHLGEVYESRPHNLKGNRENQEVMDLNNEVLAYSDGSWDCPPSHLRWNRTSADKRDAILHELGGQSTGSWGFKDPRTLLTLPFWREYLIEPRLVGTFRNPAQVTRSLRARNTRMSVAQCLELWCAYNNRLLELHTQSPFPVVSFDLDEADYRRTVDTIARDLGLTNPVSDEFFERDLRTADPVTDVELPDTVKVVYEQLMEAAHP